MRLLDGGGGANGSAVGGGVTRYARIFLIFFPFLPFSSGPGLQRKCGPRPLGVVAISALTAPENFPDAYLLSFPMGCRLAWLWRQVMVG